MRRLTVQRRLMFVVFHPGTYFVGYVSFSSVLGNGIYARDVSLPVMDRHYQFSVEGTLSLDISISVVIIGGNDARYYTR